jgi:superfamily II DNA or RNA helicase/HKD family nuclease
MSSTLTFYDNHAHNFFSDTVGVDMSDLHERFLRLLPDGALILDAGCGSGRDSKAFLNRGFRIHAFDASGELARMATDYIGQPVQVCRFDEVRGQDCYDGIWACASLLHVTEKSLPSSFKRLWRTLKPNGALYVSFKLGDSERIRGSRHFTDATEERLQIWLKGLPGLGTVECWMSQDRRPDHSGHWLNAIARRKDITVEKIITGEREHPFLPQLQTAMAHADEVDLAVAFIKTTGLRLLLPDLHAVLDRNDARTGRSARLRILTSDYLDVTDPDALRLLMLLQERGAQTRIFEATDVSFHLKAYLCARTSDVGQLSGSAFIGSSNISRMALTDGLEWNYRVNYPDETGFIEARSHFETLFRDPRTTPLTDDWIEGYAARHVPPPRPIAPGSEEIEPPPQPTTIQVEALKALSVTRQDGFQRGLVVMATGLGKTWLAAFDADQMQAKRVLFIAHREEILNQAAETFLRIRHQTSVGFYMGHTREVQVDVLCASVQTLGRAKHLEKFATDHFDYIVVDEFHHAAAPTYRRVLRHFSPRFLLGLTATPDRTDQSDILSLCDDNLVYGCDLFRGINAGLLAPFHYYGIWDESVDYKEIPWRSGRFDPEELTNKLATLARAQHALKEWREQSQQRTLAFCVSIKHAEFMAEQFRRSGVRAQAVYAGSTTSRGDALDQLAGGKLEVIFSVDLFNEGIDLPSIDTVLMLRPTESKILFLQQLGRGLRKAPEKDKLVVIDFIGNHQSFLHKPQALVGVGATYHDLAEFARKFEQNRLTLPSGCFINYDLGLLDFLKALDTGGIAKDYEGLRDVLGRRPTLSEFFRSGANIAGMRREYSSWFGLVASMDDLEPTEANVADIHRDFLHELETTNMTKSFKMILVEALLELDGLSEPPSLAVLAQRSWQVLQRRRTLLSDLPENLRSNNEGVSSAWQSYWQNNPINAWVGGNRRAGARSFFRTQDGVLEPNFQVATDHREGLANLIQETVDYRLAAYEVRGTTKASAENEPFERTQTGLVELPFFPNLPIACGHFKAGRADSEEYHSLSTRYGDLNPSRHFIARASGNSMNGGENPIVDGDYLLLETIKKADTDSATGGIMAVERPNKAGKHQYLLRVATMVSDGGYILRANNPDYEDLVANESMHAFARLVTVLDPLELLVGKAFKREDIPPLFGATFNPGAWHAGHVVLREKNTHVLLITINKQGKGVEHRYLDHWIDESTFHWQSQNSTKVRGKRGQEIINHEMMDIALHLFIRQTKLEGGKAAPFVYEGRFAYKSHTGDAPMSVTLVREEPRDLRIGEG